MSIEPQHILIATPVDGATAAASVTYGYHSAVRRLERSGSVIMPSDITFSDDLGRARSRCVRHALERSGWKWMLWWDSDVVPPDPLIVPRMLERAVNRNIDVIGAVYPRKRSPPSFPYLPLESDRETGGMRIVDECVQVAALPFGFILTSRACLERMCRWYSEDEWFTDVRSEAPGAHRTIALFRPMFGVTRDFMGQPFRELFSEDYSFCRRWTDMGGEVWMYIGDGAPLDHVGATVFSGNRADLGRAG